MPKFVGCGIATDERICELAEEEMIAPAAPAAPKRNISRRFNDTRTLPNEGRCLSFNGLMADNPYVQVARSIAVRAQLIARGRKMQRVECSGSPC
jgi:hypothetical protein